MGKHILLLFQEQVIGGSELLYFADVCAGPGGFSEYVLWRKKWDSKGFGFTLKGPCDFKLDEFFAAHSELFEPHYGKLYLFVFPFFFLPKICSYLHSPSHNDAKG